MAVRAPHGHLVRSLISRRRSERSPRIRDDTVFSRVPLTAGAGAAGIYSGGTCRADGEFSRNVCSSSGRRAYGSRQDLGEDSPNQRVAGGER